MYIEYNDYVTYYGKGVCFQDFNRLSIEACRKLDNHTTGADGVKKLRHAFPVDADGTDGSRRKIPGLRNHRERTPGEGDFLRVRWQ